MSIRTSILYGERGTAIVNESDAPAWINAGWSREPLPPPEPPAVPEPAKKGKA